MGRGHEYPGAPQHGDDPPPGARSGQLERHPASKQPAMLTVVAASPMRGSSIGDGVSRVFLYEPSGLEGLSDADLDRHEAVVERSIADLTAQQGAIAQERDRRKDQQFQQLVQKRERALAEKARLDQELAEIDAALAVMDPQTAGNA